MTGATVRVETSGIDWPDDVAIASQRVIAGAPAASTFVVESAAGRELGLWRVAPGEFTTEHAGFVEFIHVLSGAGRLLGDDGSTIELHAGVVVLLERGWKGRWVVEETLTKVYAVIDE